MCLPHRVEVGSRTLRWPTMAEVFGAETIELTTDTLEASDTLALPETSETPELPTTPAMPETTVAAPAAVKAVAPEEPPTAKQEEQADSRTYLSSFYAALAQSGSRQVRVMHYGDSQIEEDRMTSQIRQRLQERYGGSGVGLMPLAQTIPTYSVKQRLYMNGRWVTPQQGPRRYLVYGPRNMQRADGLYGPMGQVAIMADSLVKGSEDIHAAFTPIDKRPRYTQWRVVADTGVHYSFSGDTVLLTGKGAVYGLSQESAAGVIVDNIPMRGCLGLIFNKMSAPQLSRFYREANVNLIILQFGGNAIPYNENPGTIAAIVKGLREQVQFVKHCAPNASILFIGPSDMCTMVDGEVISYPLVGYMDRLLRKMAQEEEIAYFSLYRWMGGSGSMARWQEVGLATSDGVHFLRSGARKAGNAVADWILEGAN